MARSAATTVARPQVCGASLGRPTRSLRSLNRGPSSGQGNRLRQHDTAVLLRLSLAASSRFAPRQAPPLLRRCGAGLAHIFITGRARPQASTAFGSADRGTRSLRYEPVARTAGNCRADAGDVVCDSHPALRSRSGLLCPRPSDSRSRVDVPRHPPPAPAPARGPPASRSRDVPRSRPVRPASLRRARQRRAAAPAVAARRRARLAGRGGGRGELARRRPGWAACCCSGCRRQGRAGRRARGTTPGPCRRRSAPFARPRRSSSSPPTSASASTPPRPLRRRSTTAQVRQRRDAAAARAAWRSPTREAGADMIAPSDMMDGRVGAIRARARRGRASRTTRDPVLRGEVRLGLLRAVPRGRRLDARSSATAARYQMDPANAREALREVALDVDEGADMLMVKPAWPYLDVIRRLARRFDAAPRRLPGVAASTPCSTPPRPPAGSTERAAMLESLVAHPPRRRRILSSPTRAIEVAEWLDS